MKMNPTPMRILRTLTATCVGAALLFTGCAIGPKFDASGIPAHRYYVGGGILIEYKAPENGTVFVVEETTDRILVTKSIEQGEAFEFKVEVEDAEARKQFEAALGKAVNEARFALFFIPALKAKAE